MFPGDWQLPLDSSQPAVLAGVGCGQGWCQSAVFSLSLSSQSTRGTMPRYLFFTERTRK